MRTLALRHCSLWGYGPIHFRCAWSSVAHTNTIVAALLPSSTASRVCVRGTDNFCDKNADLFDSDLLRLMASVPGSTVKPRMIPGPAADFTRELFAEKGSTHRSISFKAGGKAFGPT